MSESPTLSAEEAFLAAVKNMLGRPDYLLPLAAAERQFRDHYYGLNSAALLEDLFFDALGNFLRQTSPASRLTRPPTGQKGWDYSFNGLQISHKVSQGLGQIAALWDATKTGVTTWSFHEPITYVLGQNAPSTGVEVALEDGTIIRCRAVSDINRPYVLQQRDLFIVAWPADGSQPRILDVVSGDPAGTVAEALQFERVWHWVSSAVAAGRGANEIDVLITSRRCPPLVAEEVVASERGLAASIAVPNRGGVYLLRRELLQDLAVSSNNRAILIPTGTVRALLQEARENGLFAPLPLWYWIYAAQRPPDMYFAQRAEYDARFSARG